VKRAGFHGSFWPTPTQEALLRVVLGSTEQAAPRWHELQPLDIETLDTGSFCLLPPLYERLTETDPDDPRLPRLLGTYRATWYRNQLLLDRLSELLSTFGGRGLDALVVGGAATGARWYPRLGSRPVAQLELVVAPAAGEAARAAARSTGWRPAGRGRYHGRFVDSDGRALVVFDGMPSVFAGPVPRPDAYDEVRREAVEHDLGAPALVLQPADELLYICAVGARSSPFPTVQWLLDAATMLTAAGRPTIDSVIERARRFRLIQPLQETAAYLAGICEVPGLDHDLALLDAEPVAARNRLAHRLAGSKTERLGGLPLILASHLQATSSEPLWAVIGRLPRHLEEAWELDALGEVPGAAFKKVARRARRRRSDDQRKSSALS
jgi:hypothetical protein